MKKKQSSVKTKLAQLFLRSNDFWIVSLQEIWRISFARKYFLKRQSLILAARFVNDSTSGLKKQKKSIYGD